MRVSRRAALGASAVVALALAVAVASAAAAGAAGSSGPPGAYPAGPVGHEGRWLTDSSGRVVDLHGVNVVAKDAPYFPSAFGFDDQDAAWLAEEGLHVVRLGVLASGEMPTMGHIDEGYISQLVSTVDDLGRHHIFSLLDWHQDDYGTYFDEPGTAYRADGFPTWMTVTNGAADDQVVFPYDYDANPALQQAFQSFWDDEAVPGGVGLQTYDIEMFTAVAERVKSNPWVLGYELMNEPWPGTDWLPCLGGNGCPSEEASELEPFYTKASDAIRRIDPTHMIFMEPFVLYNFGLAPTHLAMPSGVKNTGLAFHQYAQSASAEEQVFTNTLDWAQTNDGALFNTEWSSVNGSPSSISQQADLEDRAFMPWTYWIFSACDIACSSATAADLVLDEHEPPTGTNVNAPVADAVIRPYPLAVSGTPKSLSYDASTHVMTFVWSSSRAGSKESFAAGAVTSFAVPPADYPSGYAAQVVGAKVVSTPGAATLVVEQTGGSPTHSVTVSARS